MIYQRFIIGTLLTLASISAASAAGHWSSGSSSTATASVGAQVIPPFQISSSNKGAFVFAPDFFSDAELTGGWVNQGNIPLVLNPRAPMNTELTIAGEPDTAFTLSLPSKGTINISNGRRALFLDGVLSSNRTTGLLDSLGQQTLTIQAIFSMLEDHDLKGRFSGNLPMTIEHN